jgi:DnaK suppressor protein
MQDLQNISQIKQKLLKRKMKLLEHLQLKGVNRSDLQKKMCNYMGISSWENLATKLGVLDNQTIEELYLVQKAIIKINLQNYGFCESCGQQICSSRLKAIPDVEKCQSCASQTTPQGIKRRSDELAETSEDFVESTDLRESNDTAIARKVIEHIQTENIIPVKELEVSCRDGVVKLKGYLPSERSYQILLLFLYDSLSLPEIEDNIVIDRLICENRICLMNSSVNGDKL